MPSRKTNSRKPSKQRRLPGGSANRSIPHPPQFVATRRTVGRARYVSTLTTAAITRGNLLNHLYVNQSGSTNNWRLFEAFRLKSVQIWASPPSVGALSTASVEWFSTQGPSLIVSDTAVGQAEPLFVSTSPPAMSLAGFWSYSGSNESDVLFDIVVPANALVDITYEAIFQNGETAIDVTTTNSGTGGVLYMSPLNGPTTTTFIPVSYPSLS